MPVTFANSRVRRIFRNRDGSVSIITAISLIALFGSAAVSIDVGTFFNAKRKQQAANDIAAIVAAGHLTSAPQAVAAALASNGIGGAARTTIEYGTYTPDPSVPLDRRFRIVDQSAADSIRISVRDSAPLYFGSALATLLSSATSTPGGINITTRATAAGADFAAFALGSRLASLNAGIVNAVIGKMLGVHLNLSIMDYQSLAAAQVDLFQLSRSLAALTNATGLTYGQVASGSAHITDVLSALLASERLSGGGADAALGQIVQAKAGSTDLLSLASFVDFGPFASMQVTTETAMSFRVSALDAILELARVNRQGQLVSVDLSGTVPGLANVQLLIAVGAPSNGSALTKIGRAGAQVQTAQTRLFLTAQLTVLPPILSLTLPVYMELASANGTLASLSCSPGQDTPAAVISVQPSLVDAWIGSLPTADLGNLATTPSVSPAPVASVLGLAAINGTAHASIANTSPSQLRFAALDIANSTKRSSSTTDLSASVAQRLAANLSLTLGPLSLPVPPSVAQAATQGISAAAPVLDTAIDSVLTTLGLRVGEADAWVTGVRCGGAVLVN